MNKCARVNVSNSVPLTGLNATLSIVFATIGITFVLTAIHTTPDGNIANDEIAHLLKDVYQAILNKWTDTTNNILIMGDLNIGYLPKKSINVLKANKTFHWPFPDDLSTTVCSKKPHDG